LFFPLLIQLAAASVVLILMNATLGIYSRLRTAPARQKAVVLTASLVVTMLLALAAGVALPGTLLWSALTAGPVVLARVLLNLRHTRHRGLARLSVNLRGPVLVIGGAGYIGSHTVDVLLRKGKTVRVLDRMMYGGASLKEFAGHRNFELIEGDTTDISKLTLAMKDASAVVHLAGLVGDPACAVDPAFTRHTNIVATRMAKEVAQAMGIHRFVFASSCSVYGVSDTEVSELASLNPVSLYAQTKIDSEAELLGSVSDDFFVAILRFATVFGHSRRPRFDLVVNLFTAQAMNDGLITVIGPRQWRPFIHVRDLARAIAVTLDAAPAIVQSQIFNVGDSRLNMTILQAAEQVQRAIGDPGVQISVRDNVQDRRNYAVSFKKIRSVLGFEAETLMAEGIAEMVEYFRRGTYQHYLEEIYSNVAMTKRSVADFHDPLQAERLYGPLSSHAGADL
jgi:nucleoside-diphosphate-sugar epimerase